MKVKTFDQLPRGAVFINIARGRLVDEDTLIIALKSGQLFAASLDVFNNEPHFDTRLAGFERLSNASYGSATEETRRAMDYRALDNIAEVCVGAHRPALALISAAAVFEHG